MTDDDQQFQDAERTFFESEGVSTETHMVQLRRLGGSVRVLIAGEGDPVLFVPGVVTTGAVFAGLVGRLPEYQCIMIERPGTGLSPLPANPPADLESQRQVGDSLLVDVLDGLQIERSDIVCTSLGGWATFRSAAAHPDRFRRISAMAYVIGARVTGGPMSMRMPIPKRLLPRRVPATRGLVRAMLKPAGMRAAIEQGKFSDQMLDYMVALLRNTETFRNESLYNPRPFTTFGPVDEVAHSAELLAKVTSPVHLFWGTDDVFAGEESANEFASLLPRADVQMVEGAGHAPWLDEPELAAAAVRNHLGR